MKAAQLAEAIITGRPLYPDDDPVLTETVVINGIDKFSKLQTYTIPRQVRGSDWQPTGKRSRIIWRGAGNAPVFVFQNCRDLDLSQFTIDIETPTEAVIISERSTLAPGAIVPTKLMFHDLYIQGNGLAGKGIWYRSTIDSNNEHGHFDSCTVYNCTEGIRFDGAQSKEHVLTHVNIDGGATGILSSASFHMLGGAINVSGNAVQLTNVGEAINMLGVAMESCDRWLVTSGPSNASQPVNLIGCRFECDSLHADGNVMLLLHPGPYKIEGCKIGSGGQAIPRIAIGGFQATDTAIEIRGNVFGSEGASAVCPIKVLDPVRVPARIRVQFGPNVHYRPNGSDPATIAIDTWASGTWT